MFEPKQRYSKEQEKYLSSLLETIEKQYPNKFDEEVNRILKVSDGLKKTVHQKNLRRLFESSIDVHSSFSIFQKLYHPDPKLRKQAIKHVVKHYETLRDRQKEQIKMYLLDRLKDENCDVVKATLKISRKILNDVLDADVLKEILMFLLQKCHLHKNTWWHVSIPLLKIVCFNHGGNDIKMFLGILPFLLPIQEDELGAAKLILHSTYGQQCTLLKQMRQKLIQAKTSSAFFDCVFDNLDDVRNMFDVKTFIEGIMQMSLDSFNTIQKYLILRLLVHLLPGNCTVEASALVIDIFLLYLQCSKVVSVGQYLKPKEILSHTRNNKFPLDGFLKCLETVVLKTESVTKHWARLNLHDENPAARFYVMLLKILFEMHKDVPYDIFEVCFKHLCGDLRGRMELLLNFAIVPNKTIDTSIRLKCLQYLMSAVKKADSAVLTSLIDTKVSIVPYILLVGYNSASEFRKMAMEFIKFLSNAPCENRNNSFKFILIEFAKHEEEFVLDHEQIPLLTYNILSRDENEKLVENLVDLAATDTYPLYLCAGMLNITVHLNSIAIFNKTSALAQKLLSTQYEECCPTKSVILYRNINRFDDNIASSLELGTNTWNFLTSALRNETLRVLDEAEKETCPAVLVLNQITRDVFENLKTEVQTVLLDQIIELATTTQIPDVLASSCRVFKHIDLDVTLIMDHLKNMRDAQSLKQKKPMRRHISVVPTADILDMLQWKKGVTVLEFIQSKKKMQNVVSLLPVLFDILKKCLDFDEQASVEYPKQLVLSSILHCCEKTEKDSLPDTIFNVELIVQCIRASQNPQTHHHALLVLVHVAPLVPTQVLHHIMAIFTFMGSSVLRHDDTYSFQIITKIIDTVIPVLVDDGDVKQVGKVLRVFVDVLLDVPEHRRMPLYKQLLQRIDAKKHLDLFLLLVFESHVMHGSTEKQKTTANKTSQLEATPKRLDVAANLAKEFPPDIVIHTGIKVIEHLRNLPEEKSDHMKHDEACPTFNIAHHTPKQFRHYKYTIVLFMSNLLSMQEFVASVAALSDKDLLNLEVLYKDLIISILTYIQMTSKVADRNLNTPQAQFWKAMLHYSYDILDSVNALLTPQMFLLVTKGLMIHSLATVRKRALELLNAKLQNNFQYFSDCEESELYSLISPLIDIVKTVDDEDIVPEQEMIIQTALLSLKLLVKNLAPKSPQNFTQILNFVTNLTKMSKLNDNILASSILCLAELCANLRAHAIAGLPKYMPAVIRVLKSQRHQAKPSLLLLCTITALQKIIDSLPLFLSPYLEKILCELSYCSSKWLAESDDQKTAPLINKLNSIRQKIGSVIPARVLIPVVQESYDKLIEKRQFASVGSLMDILAESLSNLKGPEIQVYLPELTTFFLNALQFRVDGNASDSDTDAIETHVIKAMIVLILKLSESTFRPLYYRLFDWAIRSNDKSERIITFYSLSSKIAESLKGLFVLFAGHFLNNVASVLDTCNAIKSEQLYFDTEHKNILLIENVLKTLHSVFLYDTQTFVNRERFEVLMQPMVDQLENTVGGIDELESRSQNVLIPCIVQFAVATANDALWNQLNYQILLKMRHNVPKIRLIALGCLTSVAKKLGDDFLPLLPETIPFLAELLEDDDENVEKATQKAVQELEKVLGEPLKKYF